jgi:catechol 2,3-dioxygenase-like lactoylglutathione lyase family enzyme
MPRIDHVAVESDEPDELASFYQHVLGARITRAEGHPVMAYLEDTGFAIHSLDGPGPHTAVSVSGEERAAIKRRLDDAGVPNEERDHEIAVGLFFRDPDGRQIEAITYRDGDDPRR